MYLCHPYFVRCYILSIRMLKRGFTLVELITVMAMIGFIATITLTGLNSSRQKSRDTVRTGDMQTLSRAVESYFSEHFEFPDSLDDLTSYFTGGVLPSDPSPDRSYRYQKITTPSRGYCLGAMMEREEAQNAITCGLESVTGINYQVVGP